MNGFLLDTHCISEAVSPRPEKGVMEWLDATDEGLLYLSALTIGEIRKGVVGLGQGRRRSQMETWLERELPARFSGRILPIDAAVADRWGSLMADAKRRGRLLGVIDALLAATAIHLGLTLVTRNVSDFSHTRVSLLNPWERM